MSNDLKVIRVSNAVNVAPGLPAKNLSPEQATAFACCQKVGVGASAVQAGKNASDLVLQAAYRAQGATATPKDAEDNILRIEGASYTVLADLAGATERFEAFRKTVKTELHNEALRQWVHDNGYTRDVGAVNTGLKDEHGKAIKAVGPDAVARKASTYFDNLCTAVLRNWAHTAIEKVGGADDNPILETTNNFRNRAERIAREHAPIPSNGEQIAREYAQLATSMRNILVGDGSTPIHPIADNVAAYLRTFQRAILTLATRAQLIEHDRSMEDAREAILAMSCLADECNNILTVGESEESDESEESAGDEVAELPELEPEATEENEEPLTEVAA